MVHVVAEQGALDAAATTELHGQRPGDGAPEIVSDRERLVEIIRESRNPQPAPPPAEPAPAPGLTLGGPVIPAALLADLAARGVAELRPLTHPGDSAPEPHYRPSKALAEFIRCRDMTCRFPHCDRPGELCDIDHTTPYGAGGLTHASKVTSLCCFDEELTEKLLARASAKAWGVVYKTRVTTCVCVGNDQLGRDAHQIT